jgi:hypothetical protein
MDAARGRQPAPRLSVSRGWTPNFACNTHASPCSQHAAGLIRPDTCEKKASVALPGMRNSSFTVSISASQGFDEAATGLK